MTLTHFVTAIFLKIYLVLRVILVFAEFPDFCHDLNACVFLFARVQWTVLNPTARAMVSASSASVCASVVIKAAIVAFQIE